MSYPPSTPRGDAAYWGLTGRQTESYLFRVACLHERRADAAFDKRLSRVIQLLLVVAALILAYGLVRMFA